MRRHEAYIQSPSTYTSSNETARLNKNSNRLLVAGLSYVPYAYQFNEYEYCKDFIVFRRQMLEFCLKRVKEL